MFKSQVFSKEIIKNRNTFSQTKTRPLEELYVITILVVVDVVVVIVIL